MIKIKRRKNDYSAKYSFYSELIFGFYFIHTYYIFDLSHSEGKYDAHFHAYIMVEDSIIWSGVQPIEIEGGKKIWGEYIAVGANFNPELVVNSTPMAYVSVSYE